MQANGGSSDYSYIWKTNTNDANLASVKKDTSTLSDIKPSITNLYTVIVTDANGCIDSTNYTVNVNKLPEIELTGKDAACSNETVLLTISSLSGNISSPSYNWGDVNPSKNAMTSNVVITKDSTFTVSHPEHHRR